MSRLAFSKISIIYSPNLYLLVLMRRCAAARVLVAPPTNIKDKTPSDTNSR